MTASAAQQPLWMREEPLSLAFGWQIGFEMSSLVHTFTAVPEGTLYRSRLLIGAQHPLLRWLNSTLLPRRFPEAKARAWLKHNVEEVGNFEFFLSELYARQARVP